MDRVASTVRPACSRSVSYTHLKELQTLEQEKVYKVPVFTVGTYIFTSDHVILPEGVKFCNPLYMSDLDFANWEIAK